MKTEIDDGLIKGLKRLVGLVALCALWLVVRVYNVARKRREGKLSFNDISVIYLIKESIDGLWEKYRSKATIINEQ